MKNGDVIEQVSSFIREKGLENILRDSSPMKMRIRLKYTLIVSKIRKLERYLRRSKRFEEACRLIFDLGLKKDFTNADELIPKFMVLWEADMTSLRDTTFFFKFIYLVDLIRDEKIIGQALLKDRLMAN